LAADMGSTGCEFHKIHNHGEKEGKMVLYFKMKRMLWMVNLYFKSFSNVNVSGVLRKMSSVLLKMVVKCFSQLTAIVQKCSWCIVCL